MMDIIESLQKKEEEEGAECLSEEGNDVVKPDMDADTDIDKKVVVKDGDSDSYVTNSEGETKITEDPPTAKRKRKNGENIKTVGSKKKAEDEGGESEEELDKENVSPSLVKRKKLAPRRSWSGKTRASSKIA